MNTHNLKVIGLGIAIALSLYALFGNIIPVHKIFAEDVYESKTAELQALYNIDVKKLHRIRSEEYDQAEIVYIRECNLAKSKEMDHVVGYKKYDDIDSIREKADSCFEKYQKTEKNEGLSQE